MTVGCCNHETLRTSALIDHETLRTGALIFLHCPVAKPRASRVELSHVAGHVIAGGTCHRRQRFIRTPRI